MKSIFIHQHLGLGDHIICNGLVRELIKRDSPTFAYIPVRKQYYKTVSQMYSDDARIVCLPVISEFAGSRIPNMIQMNQCEKYYRVGFEKVRPDWDVSFYDSVDIPFEKRWDSFKMRRDAAREREFESRINPTGEPFILVHKTGSAHDCPLNTGRNDVKEIVVDRQAESLLDWCGMIEKAEEIHCVDSCFIHLCSSMGVSGVFHDFRLNSHLGYKFVLHPKWTRILCENPCLDIKHESTLPVIGM